MWKRLEGWEKRLAELVDARQHAPFAWGAFDCALFGASVALQRVCGGGLVDAIERNLWPEIAPKLARRGDIGVSETDHGPGDRRLHWQALVNARRFRNGPRTGSMRRDFSFVENWITIMLTTTIPPTGSPVSLDELKVQLRVGDGEDAYLAGLIAAATEHVEGRLGRSLLTQTLTATFDRFPACRAHGLVLSRGPVQSIEEIAYYDTDGVDATISEFQMQKTFAGAVLLPAVGASWPLVEYDRADAVTVEYTAGYGAAADVPMPIRQAIQIIAADLYERRVETITGTIVSKAGLTDLLLTPYRVVEFV